MMMNNYGGNGGDSDEDQNSQPRGGGVPIVSGMAPQMMPSHQRPPLPYFPPAMMGQGGGGWGMAQAASQPAAGPGAMGMGMMMNYSNAFSPREMALLECTWCRGKIPGRYIEKHVHEHLSYTPYKCNVCGHFFYTKEDITYHFKMGTHGLGLKPQIIECFHYEKMEVLQRVLREIKEVNGIDEFDNSTNGMMNASSWKLDCGRGDQSDDEFAVVEQNDDDIQQHQQASRRSSRQQAQKSMSRVGGYNNGGYSPQQQQQQMNNGGKRGNARGPLLTPAALSKYNNVRVGGNVPSMNQTPGRPGYKGTPMPSASAKQRMAEARLNTYARQGAAASATDPIQYGKRQKLDQAATNGNGVGQKMMGPKKLLYQKTPSKRRGTPTTLTVNDDDDIVIEDSSSSSPSGGTRSKNSANGLSNNQKPNKNEAKCTECSMILAANQPALRTHAAKYHMSDQRIHCKHCSFKEPWYPHKIKRHIKDVHPTKSLQFKDYCKELMPELEEVLQKCFPNHFEKVDVDMRAGGLKRKTPPPDSADPMESELSGLIKAKEEILETAKELSSSFKLEIERVEAVEQQLLEVTQSGTSPEPSDSATGASSDAASSASEGVPSQTGPEEEEDDMAAINNVVEAIVNLAYERNREDAEAAASSSSSTIESNKDVEQMDTAESTGKTAETSTEKVPESFITILTANKESTTAESAKVAADESVVPIENKNDTKDDDESDKKEEGKDAAEILRSMCFSSADEDGDEDDNGEEDEEDNAAETSTVTGCSEDVNNSSGRDTEQPATTLPTKDTESRPAVADTAAPASTNKDDSAAAAETTTTGSATSSTDPPPLPATTTTSNAAAVEKESEMSAVKESVLPVVVDEMTATDNKKTTESPPTNLSIDNNDSPPPPTDSSQQKESKEVVNDLTEDKDDASGTPRTTKTPSPTKKVEVEKEKTEKPQSESVKIDSAPKTSEKVSKDSVEPIKTAEYDPKNSEKQQIDDDKEDKKISDPK